MWKTKYRHQMASFFFKKRIKHRKLTRIVMFWHQVSNIVLGRLRFLGWGNIRIQEESKGILLTIYYRCILLFLFMFLRQGLARSPRLNLNLQSSHPCLPNAGIIDVYHHTLLAYVYFMFISFLVIFGGCIKAL
jgi:hypothetical protein